MSFGDYWYRKQVANQTLVADEDAKITLSLSAFRKEMEKAFQAGKIEGRSEKPDDSLFGSIFGRHRA